MDLGNKNVWLMKTEPDVFSFDDLVKAPGHTAPWDGVRNYQARNFMRDEFKVGDVVLVYHSRVDPPEIVGLAKVAKPAYPDPTALDPKSKYYDELSVKRGKSQWMMVDVTATHRFKTPVTLDQIRKTKALSKMLVIKKGMRLSIQPVTKEEFEMLCSLTVLEKIKK